MEYTEEIKKEADSIIEQYLPIVLDYPNVAINCAIQDRQSVLKEVEQAFKTTGVFHSQYWLNRIQSLTQQIEYFKSKL